MQIETKRANEPNNNYHLFTRTQIEENVQRNELKGIINKYNLSRDNIANQINYLKISL